MSRLFARLRGAVVARFFPAVVLAVAHLAGSSAQAADWPQWLGPNRDASSPEKVAPWKGDLKVAWRKPVGEGHSSPVVVGGVVYLHVKVADKDEEAVLAFDARTGESKWEKTYPRAAVKILFGNGPRATPAVASGKLFTFGITGVLSCWDVADGKRLWQVDTLKEFRVPNLTFGVSASPLVVGERVLVQVGNDPKKPQGSAAVAVEAGTGKLAWKALDDRASYASPALINGKAVFLTGANAAGLDPMTGEVLWKYPFSDLLNESSSTPVRAGDLLLVSSVSAGSVGIRLKDADGKVTPEQVWKDPALTCYFSTPVPVDDKHVFMVTGKLPPFASATLHCVESASGKVVWSRPKVGTYHASLLRTGDGNLLMLDDHGNLSLLAPDVKAYKELARSKVCPGNGDVWAHPALSGGRIYLRDAKELICLQPGE